MIIDKILRKISGGLPGRIIAEEDRPYLERYYLGTLGGLRFYLHRFVGSDPDRGVHDHPWRKAWSLILSGWYFEERRDGMHTVRWFNRISGDTFHRVILPPAGFDDMSISEYVFNEHDDLRPCWTIFVHTVGDVKPWGFLRGLPGHDASVFEPYAYPAKKKNPEWWKTAPKGRDLPGRAE